MSPALFTPLAIRGVTFANRIFVSPMCEYSCEDGLANDWHMVHLGSRAVGGAGLVMTEATAVSADARISPGDLGLWKQEHVEPLRRITAFIKSQGSVPGVQLAHAGRKGSTEEPWNGGGVIAPEKSRGWTVGAPSARAFKEGDPVPREMTLADIARAVALFASSTRLAVAAGFEVIEIHAAHGYLIHEFLSPLSNFRTDQYGGSFENRIRLLCDIVNAVRGELGPNRPLFVRISATDWTEGGWSIDDSVKLALALKPLGVDLIDCSSGGNVPGAKIPATPGYQVRFAEQIRKETGLLTGAVGLITTPEQAEAILEAGQADVISLAREFLRDPYFPMHAAQRLGVVVRAPKQYTRAYPNSIER